MNLLTLPTNRVSFDVWNKDRVRNVLKTKLKRIRRSIRQTGEVINRISREGEDNSIETGDYHSSHAKSLLFDLRTREREFEDKLRTA